MGLPPLSELVPIAHWSITRVRYCIVVAYTIQVYDWLLMLGEEIDLIHKARWTSIKTSYLICRYYPLIVYPVLMWAWLGDYESKFCERLIHPLYALLIPFQLTAQAVILIRAYAFTGRKMSVGIIFGIGFLALLGAEIWLFGTQFPYVHILTYILPRTGCFANDAMTEWGLPRESNRALRAGIVLLGAVGLDLLAMLMVVLHCIRISSTQGRLGRQFLIQATSVFVIMTVLNVMTASLFLGPDRQYDGISLPIPLILSDVMACRLILQLRRRVYPTETEVFHEQSRVVRDALHRAHSSDDEADHWA